jgi:histone H3/H4
MPPPSSSVRERGGSGSEFAITTIQRVFRRNGGQRIADDAAKELSKALEEVSYKISKQAIEFAAHAGRETIKAEDIRLASKYVVNKHE